MLQTSRSEQLVNTASKAYDEVLAAKYMQVIRKFCSTA